MHLQHPRFAVTSLCSLFAFFLLVHVLRSGQVDIIKSLQGIKSLESKGPLYDESFEGAARVRQACMVYPEQYDEIYERALKTHIRHGQKWGYSTDVLRQDVLKGYFNKLAYLFSLVVIELGKPPGSRAQWIMWFDADTIILNPEVPLTVFLPPDDFDDIHFVGNKDWNGFNAGVFFLHVHEWTVNMLAKAVAFPKFHPGVDLGGNSEQQSMYNVFQHRDFQKNIVYQPRTWFNAYLRDEGGGYSEAEKGDLLIHFPAKRGGKARFMGPFLESIENWPHDMSIPLAETKYPKLVEGFWGRLRDARNVLKELDKYQEDLPEENEEGNKRNETEIARRDLEIIMWEEPFDTVKLNNATGRVEELLGKHTIHAVSQ